MSQTISFTEAVGQQSLAIADLSVINFSKLVENDQLAIETLLNAAQSFGFFYLSFDDPMSEDIANHLSVLYKACEVYFGLPHHEKMKSFRQAADRG